MRRPLNLEYLVLVRLERVQLQLEISQIPQRNGFVGAAGGQYVLRVWIEREAVDLGCVGVNSVRWFARVVAPCVPNHQLLVVRHRAKEALVQQMPGDILNHGRVACENGLGIDDAVFFGSGVDVPQANRVVV